MWKQDYGALTSDSLIAVNLPGPNGILLIDLAANSPQAVLSFLVLTRNGVFTCMLLAEEYNGDAFKQKALRVTRPTGLQR